MCLGEQSWIVDILDFGAASRSGLAIGAISGARTATSAAPTASGPLVAAALPVGSPGGQDIFLLLLAVRAAGESRIEKSTPTPKQMANGGDLAYPLTAVAAKDNETTEVWRGGRSEYPARHLIGRKRMNG